MTSASVPLLLRFCRDERFLDRARLDRFSTRSVPRLGGQAVLLGVLAALSLAPLWAARLHVGVAVFAGALVAAAALGHADDRNRLPAWLKGMLEALLLTGGFLLARALSHPEQRFELAPPDLFWFAPACALQLALNIYDNMDGALVAGVLPGLLWLAFATPADPLSALAMAGGLTGFFLWNRPPARVFLGNLGSRVVSLGVAWLVLDQSVGERPSYAMRSFLPFLMPAADLVIVVFRRLGSGRRPWMGGRDHTTHELARILGSERRALVCITLLGIGACLVASNGWPR